MKKYMFPWMNKGKEFEIPELTIGDIKKSKKDSLELIREYKDIRGDKNLDEYIEQETAFGLVSRILKRIDPTITDTIIDDNLTINNLNNFTSALFDVNREVLKKAGINVENPRNPPSKP